VEPLKGLHFKKGRRSQAVKTKNDEPVKEIVTVTLNKIDPLQLKVAF
jgi:hypothetical protein